MSTVTQETLSGAGKVIAVHENYRRRAEQRAQVPAFPSYFLKPSSSLGLSGGTVERPPGCQQLSLRGEVALVIGTAARRVNVADAWGHVAFVTAANDLSLDELEPADEGSHLRARGGDGFTPLGHFLLLASHVDPDQLELRTWVNGTLVQDDSTAGLLFPFTQLIAELSQLMTLMPGDVILTGTPAGSCLVAPGDVMEVSVVDPASGESTGRLHTTVTAGTVPLGAFDARSRATEAENGAGRAAHLNPLTAPLRGTQPGAPPVGPPSLRPRAAGLP